MSLNSNWSHSKFQASQRFTAQLCPQTSKQPEQGGRGGGRGHSPLHQCLIPRSHLPLITSRGHYLPVHTFWGSGLHIWLCCSALEIIHLLNICSFSSDVEWSYLKCVTSFSLKLGLFPDICKLGLSQLCRCMCFKCSFIVSGGKCL